MIIVYTGKNGSGKSISACQRVFSAWLRGRNVYTNISSFNPQRPLWHRWAFFWQKTGLVFYFKKLSEIYHVKNAIIFIDEAAKLLNARSWESIPAFFCERLREQRKLGLDVITTTPSLKRILVDYRELVGEWYWCRRFIRMFPIENWPCLFFIYIRVRLDEVYSDTGSEREAPTYYKICFPRLFIPWPWKKSLYDTHEVLSSNYNEITLCLKKRQLTVKMTDSLN